MALSYMRFTLPACGLLLLDPLRHGLRVLETPCPQGFPAFRSGGKVGTNAPVIRFAQHNAGDLQRNLFREEAILHVLSGFLRDRVPAHRHIRRRRCRHE